jgi:hypothetical protein
MNTSSTALFVSFISLSLSLYVMRRERGLAATAGAHMDDNELIGYKIGLYVVNQGRSPITLRTMVIKGHDGETFKHSLRNDEGNPIKLSQSEFHEFMFTQSNSEITTWAKSKIKTVKIVDSYGGAWDVMDFANIINNHHHSGNSQPALEKPPTPLNWTGFIDYLKSRILRKPGL